MTEILKYDRVSYRTWKVLTTKKEYLVSLDYRGWHCDCFYYSVKKRICSHIKYVKEHEHIDNTPEDSLK